MLQPMWHVATDVAVANLAHDVNVEAPGALKTCLCKIGHHWAQLEGYIHLAALTATQDLGLGCIH